jgi:hypothetical protein
MTNHDLGANQFTFAGDRTRINYETQTPIPSQGPLMQYQGLKETTPSPVIR